MIKISFKIITISLVGTLLILNGCKTKKEVGEKSISGTKSAKEVIHDVLDGSLKYTTISTKGSIELLLGDSKKKFPAAFKIEKDKAMQVSLRDPFLGAIEGARITFTVDSIIILDRMKQRYVAEKYSNSPMTQDIDFNFNNLQAILTNHIFVPGTKKMNDSEYSKFKLSVSGANYLATIKDKNSLQYTFAIDGNDNLTSTSISHSQKNIAIKWNYTDFVIDGKNNYPTTMTAQISMQKNMMNVVISYSKLNIDKPIEIERSIPSKYKKVGFKEFIDSYMKL